MRVHHLDVSYRAAKNRPASARALRDTILIEELKRIHAENYGVYGVRKMHHAMRRAGWEIGRDQVARLMKLAGVEGVRRGRTRACQLVCVSGVVTGRG
ncbi:IS3 family transposase [Micrococcus luteus]|nr:IS3 family transposase [Micrococcus yunnanensis]